MRATTLLSNFVRVVLYSYSYTVVDLIKHFLKKLNELALNFKLNFYDVNIGNVSLYREAYFYKTLYF